MNRRVPTVWDHLDEIAETLPPRRWMLVGGLMVHAHAELAGLRHARPTQDADVVVEVRAGSYAEAAAALGRLGYARHEPLDHRAPFHRFERPDGQVDLMAPEGTHIRFSGRPVLAVPGSRSALNRTIGYQTPGGVTIRIPDLASALSLKGAAHRTPSANPVRHLQDAVTLFACANTAPLIISKSMRTNINHLLTAFDDPEAWAFTDPADRPRAIRAIRSLRSDWTPPSAVLPRRPGRNQ